MTDSSPEDCVVGVQRGIALRGRQRLRSENQMRSVRRGGSGGGQMR